MNPNDKRKHEMVRPAGADTPNEDKMTLEQRESALARYLDVHGNSAGDLRITTTSKANTFSLTNNMMSLRLMQPKESSIFPLEPPPMKTSDRFNATQFRN